MTASPPAGRRPAAWRQDTQRSLRRARLAVAALFITNGAVFANLLARYPELKHDLGLTNAALGAAIAAFPLGALLVGLAGGALVHRFRSSRVAVAGTVVTGAALVAAGTASGWVVLASAMFLAGAMDALVDVAQNAHALRVQRRYGRSILNSFHAVWSAGAVLGGLMGSAAAGFEVSLLVHLGGSGLLLSAVALAAYRFLLPGPEDAERHPPERSMPAAEALAGGTPGPGHWGVAGDVATPSMAGASPGAGTGWEPAGASPAAGTGWEPLPAPAVHVPGAHPGPWPAGHSVAAVEPAMGGPARAAVGALLALGVIAASGAVVEDAGASWGAIYLTGSIGAAAGVAGLAFVALQSMQFVGRLLGDRLVDRYGQRTVARAGGAITAAGMGLALLLPSTATTLIGFGAAGLGVATLIPAAMQAADELPGLRPGTGLTAVSWLLRVGFLLSPPIVGAIADAVGLRVGLLVVPIAGVTVLLLSRHLAPGSRPVP